WLNDPKHHERIFATFQRYDENRISQNYVFLALAPILPLIGLCTHLRVILQERLADSRRAVADRLSNASQRLRNGNWTQRNDVFGPPVMAAAGADGGSFSSGSGPGINFRSDALTAS